MSTLDPSARPLANPAHFNDFLDAQGILTDRDAWAEEAGYDHRARKLDFESHFRALVLLHVSAYRSARDLTWAAQEDCLFQALGADFDISVPGFCGATAGRPLAPYRQMLTRVMQAVETLGTQRLRGLDRTSGAQVAALFGPVQLFDATAIDLPPSLAEAAQAEAAQAEAAQAEAAQAEAAQAEAAQAEAAQAEAAQAEAAQAEAATHDAAGETPLGTCDEDAFAGASPVKLQVKLSGTTGAVQEALITRSEGNDNAHFERLLDLPEHTGDDTGSETGDDTGSETGDDTGSETGDDTGSETGETGPIYLFDAGYWKIDTYHAITEAGAFFVTKLHGNISPKPATLDPADAERPVPASARDPEQNAAGYAVKSDRYVCLSPSEAGCKRWYRVVDVEVSTGESVSILTNLLWWPAETICQLYRRRWAIEIVFRGLKRQLQLDHVISRDPTGVVRQVLTALIVWGLLMLAHEPGEGFSPKQLWRQLQAGMHRAIFELGRRYERAGKPPDD